MRKIDWDKPLYHVTSARNLKSILRNGLRVCRDPGFDKVVYLTFDLQIAIDHGGNFPDPVVLEIRLPHSWSLYADPYIGGDECVVSDKDIPPKYVRERLAKSTTQYSAKRQADSVLTVDKGRGFIIEHRTLFDFGNGFKRLRRKLVVTASHCLPHPPVMPCYSYQETTYQKFACPAGGRTQCMGGLFIL